MSCNAGETSTVVSAEQPENASFPIDTSDGAEKVASFDMLKNER